MPCPSCGSEPVERSNGPNGYLPVQVCDDDWHDDNDTHDPTPYYQSQVTSGFSYLDEVGYRYG